MIQRTQESRGRSEPGTRAQERIGYFRPCRRGVPCSRERSMIRRATGVAEPGLAPGTFPTLGTTQAPAMGCSALVRMTSVPEGTSKIDLSPVSESALRHALAETAQGGVPSSTAWRSAGTPAGTNLRELGRVGGGISAIGFGRVRKSSALMTAARLP